MLPLVSSTILDKSQSSYLRNHIQRRRLVIAHLWLTQGQLHQVSASQLEIGSSSTILITFDLHFSLSKVRFVTQEKPHRLISNKLNVSFTKNDASSIINEFSIYWKQRHLHEEAVHSRENLTGTLTFLVTSIISLQCDVIQFM